jgi:ABC-type sugar transport system substrate-binding protein
MKRSLASNWVPDEADYGREHDILIPVTFDGSLPPLGFQQLLAQNLEAWAGNSTDLRFQKIVTRIRKLREQPARQPESLKLTSVLAAPDWHVDADLIRSRYAAIRNKRIFLIASSINEEWQIALNFHLMQAAQRADLLCSVLVPFEDHSVEQQRALLQSARSTAEDYAGGIIICSGWPDHFMDELAAIIRQLSIPVVLVDRNPPPPPDSVFIPKLAYVSVSDGAGGEYAANAVLQLARRFSIKRILVIAGFAKSERHESFQRKLMMSEKLKGCDLIVTQDGKFDRWIAENVAYNRIDEAIDEGKPFDVVFCTADSMTLGCLDAIERLAARRQIQKPRVIGYDGTATTKSLVDSGHSPLARIVIQDSKELAGTAIAQLIRLQGEDCAEAKKIIWIHPYLYPSIDKITIGQTEPSDEEIK